MEIGDNRQQEQDERLQADTFSDYWAKREADMRDQKEFWRRWNERWNVNESWPFRR